MWNINRLITHSVIVDAMFLSGVVALILGVVPLLLARPLLSRKRRWLALVASIALWLAVDRLLFRTVVFFVNVMLAYGCSAALRLYKSRKPSAITIEDAFFATTLAGCVAAELFQVVNTSYIVSILLPVAYVEMQIVAGVLAALVVNRFGRIKGSAIMLAVFAYGASLFFASQLYVPMNIDGWLIKRRIAAPLIPSLSTFFLVLIALRLRRQLGKSPLETGSVDGSPGSDSSGRQHVFLEMPGSESPPAI